MFARLRAQWSALNEWIRALVLAFVALGFLHAFVVRFVSVRSTSMYATLLPGDLVLVDRWNTWTGFRAGDIAVFHDPIQDDRVLARRQLLIKRIVGLPGATVRLSDGQLFVDGERMATAPNATWSHLVRMQHGADPRPVLKELGLPDFSAPAGRSYMELPLNATLAARLEARAEVVGAEPMRMASGAPRHIFPFSPNYRWNTDDYGPLAVPKRGDTLVLNGATIALYDRIISRYEGHDLKNQGDRLVIDGTVTDRYVVEQDYYFVLGDSRHFSSDSRFWGFVPHDHLVGRASLVILSGDYGPALSDGSRTFTAL